MRHPPVQEDSEQTTQSLEFTETWYVVSSLYMDTSWCSEYTHHSTIDGSIIITPPYNNTYIFILIIQLLKYIKKHCLPYINDMSNSVGAPWKGINAPHPLPRTDYEQLYRIMDHIIDGFVLLKHCRFHGEPTPGARAEIRNQVLVTVANITPFAEIRKIYPDTHMQPGKEAVSMLPQLWYSTVQRDWNLPNLRANAAFRKGRSAMTDFKRNIRIYALVNADEPPGNYFY